MNIDPMNSSSVRYRSADASGLKVFYRDAGESKAPAILRLHGFPTSSHMFRGLIPLLADRYHVIAPDLPGFGFTQVPQRTQFKYSFENLAGVIDASRTPSRSIATRSMCSITAPGGFPASGKAPRAPHRDHLSEW